MELYIRIKLQQKAAESAPSEATSPPSGDKAEGAPTSEPAAAAAEGETPAAEKGTHCDIVLKQYHARTLSSRVQ